MCSPELDHKVHMTMVISPVFLQDGAIWGRGPVGNSIMKFYHFPALFYPYLSNTKSLGGLDISPQ